MYNCEGIFKKLSTETPKWESYKHVQVNVDVTTFNNKQTRYRTVTFKRSVIINSKLMQKRKRSAWFILLQFAIKQLRLTTKEPHNIMVILWHATSPYLYIKNMALFITKQFPKNKYDRHLSTFTCPWLGTNVYKVVLKNKIFKTGT